MIYCFVLILYSIQLDLLKVGLSQCVQPLTKNNCPKCTLTEELYCIQTLFIKWKVASKLGQWNPLTVLNMGSAGIRVNGHRNVIRGHWSLLGKNPIKMSDFDRVCCILCALMRQEQKSIACIRSKVKKRSLEVKMSYFTTITKNATCYTIKDPGPPHLVSRIP